MGCFLDDLRAFGINADQWMTAAQDEEEWRRTAEQGAEHFICDNSINQKSESANHTYMLYARNHVCTREKRCW